jgi:hypothetical protein
MNDKRMIAWPAFERKDFGDGGITRRIRAKAIHGLGGKGDELCVSYCKSG